MKPNNNGCKCENAHSYTTAPHALNTQPPTYSINALQREIFVYNAQRCNINNNKNRVFLTITTMGLYGRKTPTNTIRSLVRYFALNAQPRTTQTNTLTHNAKQHNGNECIIAMSSLSSSQQSPLQSPSS